ncbi:hypothetical protein [Streptomyces sp. NPDC001750]|uniref:hypothetical protein n=1 Tax=Streptomyces sp. NPDC001750 TaxID=3364607 RepID=UPI0036D075CD
MAAVTVFFRRAYPVLAGELMTPLTVQYGEAPRSPVLPDVFDVVRVGLGLGLRAVDHLAETKRAAGPFLRCRLHSVLLIPVDFGSADRWRAPHSECSRHTTVETIRCGQGYDPACQSRVWVEPLGLKTCAVTDSVALHDVLSLQRSRLARGAWQSPVREPSRV